MYKHFKSIVLGLLVILTTSFGLALAEKSDIIKPEKYYIDKYCKGKTEVVLIDRSRVDCIQTWSNEAYVIEFEFANNFKESMGQVLHYSTVTGKKGGIVLILRNENDIKYLKRLERMNMKLKYPIKIKVVEVE